MEKKSHVVLTPTNISGTSGPKVRAKEQSTVMIPQAYLDAYAVEKELGSSRSLLRGLSLATVTLILNAVWHTPTRTFVDDPRGVQPLKSPLQVWGDGRAVAGVWKRLLVGWPEHPPPKVEEVRTYSPGRPCSQFIYPLPRSCFGEGCVKKQRWSLGDYVLVASDYPPILYVLRRANILPRCFIFKKGSFCGGTIFVLFPGL